MVPWFLIAGCGEGDAGPVGESGTSMASTASDPATTATGTQGSAADTTAEGSSSDPSGSNDSGTTDAPGFECGAELDSAWGIGDDVGTLAGDVWTPGRDADGRINCVSWETVPIGRWVEVTGTRLDALDAEVKAAVPGWSDRGNEDWDGVLADWVGMAWDTRQGTERGWVTVGGGHDGSSNDGVYRFDLRWMQWSVERMPSDASAWPESYNASFTNFTPAAEYYASNPTNPEGVYGDEFFDPTNPAISSRTPTARHTYGSTVFVPELGGAGKVLMGCRRYWEYDVETATWSLPKFPFDAAADYTGETGYLGENMNGWWNAAEGRYYVSPTQNYGYSQSWSVAAGGSDWRWEGGYPFGGYEAYSTALDQRGATLHTLQYTDGYVDGVPGDEPEGAPEFVRITDLETRESVDHALTLDDSLAGTTFALFDGAAIAHVAETGQYLANANTADEGMIWVWIDEATWVAARAAIEGSYPVVVNINTETKLEYFPEMHALIWVNIAQENVRIIRFS
jgi:hypothetical protein